MTVWPAIELTLRVAGATTAILLVLGTPMAWWLAGTQSRVKPLFEAIVALPLVLPPTVLGFYLLIAMGPQGPFGTSLTFTFTGLVVASVIYSLPFVVQPLQNSFETIGRGPLEAAATLGLSPLRRFFGVVVPIAARGYITAAVLGFAHTLGEFGVVLMVGGNIPGRTQVLSIVIYEQVESLDYATAHRLSAGLLVFSLIVLCLVYAMNHRKGLRGV